MSKRISFEEFQKRIDKLHKDKRYRCKKESFTGTHNAVEVYCVEHSELFICLANNLLKGRKPCKGCQLEKTKQEFLIKAQKTHPKKFIYDMDSYIDSKQAMRIFCIACDKWFYQSPASHARGCGCEGCRIRGLTKTTEQFILDASSTHNNFYTYLKTIYTGVQNKVIITCPIHGDFLQTPTNHLKGGGCVNCVIERFKKKYTKTTEQFLLDAKVVHGDRYIYPSNIIYEHNNNKIIIICREHGEFSQTPNNHLLGHGCPMCGKQRQLGGLNFTTIERCKNKLIETNGIIYTVKCYDNKEEFFKIGITKRSTQKRFQETKSLPYNYDIVYEYKSNYYNAFYIEQYLQEICKNKSYTPSKYFGGHTECFSEIPSIEEIEKHIQDVLTSIENNTHRDHLN